MSDSDGSGGWGGDATGDSVTETTSRSWFSRIGGALVGVLLGLLLIPGGVWLLAWNEGRAVQTARSLAEGARLVLAVPAERVDPSNEGRLVQVTGPLESLSTLADPAFGTRVEGATRLRRSVEMYQWKEERHSETRSKLGGGQETVTTWTYSRGWSEQAIDSSRFHQPGGHANPPMPYRTQTLTAEQGRIGAFRLDAAVLGQLGAFRPLPAEAVPQRAGATPIEGGFQTGDPAAPRIGDLRVTWSVARTTDASVLGQQAGDGLVAFQTRAGDRLLMAADGRVPAAAMIRQAEEANAVLTWVLRAAGALVIFIGALLILQPLVVLADIVPLFGSIIGFGTGLVALLVTVVVAPVTIAIAWLWVRPMVGAAVLALAALLIFGVTRLMQARKAAKLAAAPPPMRSYAPARGASVPGQPPRPGGAWGAPSQGTGRSGFFPKNWQPPQR
jgi:hypothetical protein